MNNCRFLFDQETVLNTNVANVLKTEEKTKELTENEVRTVLAVFGELRKMPYDKLNTFLGSLTIEEMNRLNEKLNGWYQGNVLGKAYSEDFGWYDPIL